MRYEKAFAELIVIDSGDVITKSGSWFDSSEEHHDHDDRDDKWFPGRHPRP